MSRALVLSTRQWKQIHQQLAQEYPPSHLLIRSVMQRELGFTVRRHACWITKSDADFGSGYYRDEIHVDFYNESAKTFFTLKYLHNEPGH